MLNVSYKNLERQLDKISHHARQGSFKTRERYLEGSKRFCKFLAENYKTQKFSNAQDKHVKAYIDHMQEKGLSASTVKTELASIRYFHEQSGSRHQISKNEKFELVRRQFGGVDRSWSEKEYREMIDHARSLGQDRIADSMILAREQGLRIHEALRIDRATAESALRTGQLHIKGKGGLERDVPLREPTRELLERKIKDVERGQKLFIGSDEKTHLVIKQTQNWIVRHRDKFTEKRESLAPATFHGLRHSYAKEEYEKRISDGLNEYNARLEVSELLGHSRDDVTRIYLVK